MISFLETFFKTGDSNFGNARSVQGLFILLRTYGIQKIFLTVYSLHLHIQFTNHISQLWCILEVLTLVDQSNKGTSIVNHNTEN